MSVPFVYRQHQQDRVYVKSKRNTTFEIVKEKLNTRSEQRPEDLCSTVTPHIEKLSSEYDLMQHPINQSLIDRFERLLKSEFLSLLRGNIIEYHV